VSARLTQVLKWGFSIGLLLLLFSWVDWRSGLQLLRQVRAEYLLLNFILFPVALAVAARRWLVLLRPHGISLSLLEGVKIYWIGIYLSNFLPSNIGGDISRVGLMSRFNKTAQIAASVVVERFLGLLALLLFASVAAVIRPSLFVWHGGVYAYWAGVGLLVVAVLMCVNFSQEISGRFIGAEGAGLYHSVQKKIGKLLISVERYRDWRLCLQVVGWSGLYYLVGFVAHFSVAKALGLDIDFHSIVLIAPLILLISMIPVSVNAIGLAEGAFVVFYSHVGLEKHEALAFALLLRFLQLLCSGVGGILLLSVKRELSVKGQEKR